MDKRNLRIMGLKAVLYLREFEAIFCDLEFVGASSKLRQNYRLEFVPQIDRANKETCLTIANLYSEMGNKKQEQKYYSLAKKYAYMGLLSNQNPPNTIYKNTNILT